MKQYHSVFKHGDQYYYAAGESPDLHEGGPCQTKEDALLGARLAQIKRGWEPGFVLDLTNADPSELAAYLR